VNWASSITPSTGPVGARAQVFEQAQFAEGHGPARIQRLGVGWATVMAAVIEYGTPLVDDPGRMVAVQQLGLDEAKYQKAGPRRYTRYATGFVGLDRGQLLDVVPGGTGP
jgi:hypothetical protein